MPKCAICGADHVSCGGPASPKSRPVGFWEDLEKDDMLQKPGFLAVVALFLTADGKLCDRSDPARHELLCGPGQIVPRVRAIELGLIQPDEDEFTPDEDSEDGGAVSVEELETENAVLKGRIEALEEENAMLKAKANKPAPRTAKPKTEPAPTDEPAQPEGDISPESGGA